MSIGQDLINEFNRQMDYLRINYGAAVKVFYPPKLVDCSNCSNVIGDISQSRYLSGGPIPVNQLSSKCGMCGGTGKREQEVFDYVPMAVHRNAKLVHRIANKLQLTISIPENTIITVCQIKFTPDIKKCTYIITDENTRPLRYKKFIDPIPHGLGYSFVLCFWKQDG